MAINFPSNPTNAQEVTEGNVTYVYNATKGYWESSEVSSGGASITVYADMTALIAATGMSDGDQAFVTANNNLYLYSGSGWYKIATVQNDSPSAITGVNGTYSLAIDGTPTVITAVSTDPEGFPLTWSYSTSGLGSIATVSQTDNVFTITPSTNDTNDGTFTLTINATDGVNGAVSTNTSIELEFIITNSNYTTLLATAVDTSDNNNITDASTNSHTITVTGDAHAGTFSPYRSGGYSLEFNGSNSRVGIQSSNVQIGTSAFSMEFWLYSRAYSGSISSKYSASTSNGYFMISTTTSDGFRCRTRSAGGTQYYVNSGSGTYNLNEWNHCIFQRDANGNLTSYLNGTKYTGDNDGSTNLSATELALGVFNYTGYEGWLDGYIRDFKLTIGTSALRTASTITVPTEPLASDSNTTAFLGYLPYLADGSNSPNSVVSSNASTSPFSPYDYKEYSATDHGGSVYFDGSGDKLTIGGSVGDFNFGTNSFTIECWAYHQAAAVGPLFNTHRAGTGDGYYIALLSNGGVNWGNYVDGTGDISTSANVITQSTWNHISVNRDSSSSNSLKIYVNGILRYTGTSATDYNTFNYGPFVGGYDAGGVQYDFTGYLSDIIVVNGSVLRTGGTSVGDVAFTPPSTPIATPSNTKLHIKGTDASIIDKSQSTNLQLVGNTTGSTTQVKFAGSKSMYFDNTGDEIQTSPSNFFSYGTGDFTWEFWMNPSSQGTYDYIITQGSSSGGTNGLGFYLQGGVCKVWHSGAAIIIGTTSISNNTWYHVALAREGTTMRLFLDGTLEGSATNSADIQSGASYGVVIGRWTEIGDAQYYDGYLQDLRVTKGLARYTANFTPPTEPLKG